MAKKTPKTQAATEKPPAPSPEEAAATIKQDADRRCAACLDVIAQALDRYKCKIVAQPVLTNDGRLAANAAVRPRT